MTISTATAAQRQTLVEKANMLSLICHKFAEDGFLDTDNTGLMAKYEAAITALSDALTAAGYPVVPASSAVIATGTSSKTIASVTTTTARAAAATATNLSVSFTVNSSGVITSITLP